jgi:hypothetical protein
MYIKQVIVLISALIYIFCILTFLFLDILLLLFRLGSLLNGLLIHLYIFFKIVIEGFKSYREQIAIEDFSPKVNCVGNNFIEKLLDDFFY